MVTDYNLVSEMEVLIETIKERITDFEYCLKHGYESSAANHKKVINTLLDEIPKHTLVYKA